jgi:hypothetical protein
MFEEARSRASRMWCAVCLRVTEALGTASSERCERCGGELRPDRRGAGERRRSGRLQRSWDPEPRTGTDRRRPFG